jgi:hypothetical protein
MAKRKAGLHKEIASIFDGVPIVNRKDDGQSPPPDRTGSEQRPGLGKGPLESRLPPRPSVLTANTPEASPPQPPAQPTPKSTPTEQRSKTAAAAKIPEKPAWQQTWEQIKDKLLAPKQVVNAARQKTMVMLVPVLFIAFIFVFIKVLMPTTRKTHAFIETEPTNTVAASTHKIDWQLPPPYPATLRDPMQRVSVSTPQAQTETANLIVKAIVYSEDKPSAIIGRQIVHPGDEVSGATIVKINRDSVEFEMNGKRWKQKVQ